MNNDERLFELTGKVAATEVSAASAHKRLDNLDKLTNSVYTLASSVEGMSAEVKGMMQIMVGVRESQRDQGKRLGKLEKTVEGLPWLKERLDDKAGKLDEVRQEPAKKWKAVVGYVIGGVVTLIIGFLVGGLFY